MDFCAKVWLETERSLRVVKIPPNNQSHIGFLTNLSVLQTPSTNQTAANEQGIHGLLESDLPCTLNMVLHANTM